MRRSSSCSSENAKFMRRIAARPAWPLPLPTCTQVYMNIRELRATLAAVVRRGEAGHRTVITVGGRPPAQLGPVEAADAQPSLDELAARGLLHRARRPHPEAEVVIALPVGSRLDR